jgi:hypothetical protein
LDNFLTLAPSSLIRCDWVVGYSDTVLFGSEGTHDHVRFPAHWVSQSLTNFLTMSSLQFIGQFCSAHLEDETFLNGSIIDPLPISAHIQFSQTQYAMSNNKGHGRRGELNKWLTLESLANAVGLSGRRLGPR